jgi:hypothetical protein
MKKEDKAWLDTKLKQDTEKAWELKDLQHRLESARIQCTQHQESTNEWRYSRSKVAELEDRISLLNNG